MSITFITIKHNEGGTQKRMKLRNGPRAKKDWEPRFRSENLNRSVAAHWRDEKVPQVCRENLREGRKELGKNCVKKSPR
jgi:hypothetical protein